MCKTFNDIFLKIGMADRAVKFQFLNAFMVAYGTYNHTKVLANIGQFDNYALELLKQYNNEASKSIELRGKRVDGTKYVVLSKDPIDIAEMSTGRKWTSCTNVYDGGSKDYVSYDIYEGTFIAYLIGVF